MAAPAKSTPVPAVVSPAAVATRRRIWLAATAIVLATVAAYCNSFHGPFVFDDLPGISENGSVQGEWWEAFTPPNAGQTVTGRPLVNLSLALNYSIGGFQVLGYHLLNLAIHLLAALALFGFVRRTLLLPSLRERFGATSLPLALASTLVWTLHPLQTESVTYIIQRAEAMMGLFYFLTFYCYVRSADARPQLWLTLSVLSCLLGVMCKEVIITAPVLVWLFDWIFISNSWSAPFRERRWYYGGLALVMLLQIWFALEAGTRGGSAGFGAGVAWWAYALSQYPAIVQYLLLSFWPSAQTLDYGTALAQNVWTVLPSQILVMALMAGTLWALVRRPKLGFLGAWFFVALAPSSSVVPITTETMAEHRMYVSLAALVVLAVLLLNAMLGRRTLVAATALAFAFGLLTFNRNRDYSSAAVIWTDSVRKNPDVARASNNYGIALTAQGRFRESAQAHRIALKLSPRYPDCETNLGSALLELGQPQEALMHFQKAARELPKLGQIHYSLGNAYRTLGQWNNAAKAYGDALKVMPGFYPARGNLMGVYNELKQFDKTILLGRVSVAWNPDFVSGRNNLANAYIQTNQPALALNQYTYLASKANPTSGAVYLGIANCLVMLGQLNDAVPWYQVALTWAPRDPSVHNNLGTVLYRLGHVPEAIQQYNEALQIAPNFTDARNNLENSLRNLNNPAPANSRN